MSTKACSEIAEWFMQHHKECMNGNRLNSWAGRLGIELDRDGKLENSQLFHLFLLAILWNSEPTFKVEVGEQVFLKIKGEYTLANFDKTRQNESLSAEIALTASKVIGNQGTLNILRFLIRERGDIESVWSEILRILESPFIGNRRADVNRLRRLYHVFNPPHPPRPYSGKAYLTVKLFLIFRELRIQFRDTGKYQYHPIVCCPPDSRVRQALKALRLFDSKSNNIDARIHASEIVAKQFCNDRYELYDLPLFFWIREGKPHLSSTTRRLLNLASE
jgi:hypothetical protein